MSTSLDDPQEHHRTVESTPDKSGLELDSASSSWEGGYAHFPRCATCGLIDLSEWEGYGTALKPAAEIIVVAIKPCAGTFAENAQRYGVAGLWIDGARIEGTPRTTHSDGNRVTSIARSGHLSGKQPHGPVDAPAGRFPANLILDEEAAAALDEQSGELKAGVAIRHRSGGRTFGGDIAKPSMQDMGYGGSGGASRFFYVAKASRSERGEGNTHPTVKPLALMRYLARLTRTPSGGVVLDPFAGSGTTALACLAESRRCILIEKDAHSLEIAARRIQNRLDSAQTTLGVRVDPHEADCGASAEVPSASASVAESGLLFPEGASA